MIFPSIRARVLALAIIPTTTVSALFFGYFVNKQINDIEASLVTKGSDVAIHLASASEYGVFSGNLTLLSPLVDSAYKEAHVASITITDNSGVPLIQRPHNHTPTQDEKDNNSQSDHYRIFSKPIVQSALEISDFDEPEETLPSIIGWVVVEISNDLTEERKHEAITETLFITLITLIVSIIIAMRISRHITTPITTITNAVKEIELGNLDVSINTHSVGELLFLEQGIRGMLRSIKTSHQDSQKKIDRATIELRNSLKLLEQKNTDINTARQEALSASQAKSSFLANISHEIRTPMNGILGFVELLNNSSLSKEQLEYLKTIKQSAHNLLGILNDVLDLSKIESGKLLINNVQFNLRDCIEDAEILVSPSANEKNLELAAIFYDDTPEIVIAPQDRITQIMINLLGNAIKFSQRGTIIIRAMIESRNNDTATIKISVSDQGPGITEKDQKILFNSFTQLDESNTRKHGGAGLGLSISKSLSEAMGGNIGVESLPDEGSIFWFTFKCDLLPSKDIIEESPQHFTGKSVGLYDSNELSRLCNSHAFRKLGFTVHEFFDIDDFLHHCEQNPDFDLFSLNLTCHESKNIPRIYTDSNHPIAKKSLLILNNANPDTLDTLRDKDSCTWIIRPFKTSELITTLTHILTHCQSEQDTTDKIECINDDVPITELTRRRLDGISVLVAEDNPINTKFISTILLRSGAKITSVTDGGAVVDKYTKDEFDIILMDINMPTMSGIEATKQIRNLEGETSRIPILGLTAISHTEEKTMYKDAGLDDVLEKPIAADELLHEIAYWVHAGKAQPGIQGINNGITGKIAITQPSQTTNTPGNPRLGIDKDLSVTMYDMLLDELPSTREILIESYSQKDWVQLRSAIHRFLGGLSYCDAPKLQGITGEFQQSLKSQDAYLQQNFEEMINEIDALILSEII